MIGASCYYHTDRDAVASCVNCGRLVCDECKVDLNDSMYCNDCVNALLVVSKKSNWFERHLHWTAVLTFLGAVFAVGLVYGVYITMDPYMSLEAQGIIDFLVASIVLAIGWGWVLKQKQRSLAWLLLAIIVPLGWLSIFALENRSRQSSLQEAGQKEDVTQSSTHPRNPRRVETRT